MNFQKIDNIRVPLLFFIFTLLSVVLAISIGFNYFLKKFQSLILVNANKRHSMNGIIFSRPLYLVKTPTITVNRFSDR